MKASTSKSSTTTSNPNAISVFQNAQASLPGSYSPVTGGQIDGFLNPYTASVIDATTQRNAQSQRMALNQIDDAAQKAGAFGGTRQAVADSLTRGQYDLNNQQTAAALNSQNYSQALQAAMTQNQAINQYPLAVQSLLGQLAQGTQSHSTTKGSSLGLEIGGQASSSPNPNDPSQSLNAFSLFVG